MQHWQEVTCEGQNKIESINLNDNTDFFIIGLSLYFLVDYLQKRNVSRKKYRLPGEIKSRFNKISVAATAIEILSNEYLEEKIEEGYNKVKAIDALYDSNRNYEQVQKFASVVVYYFLSMGKKYRFRSESIDLHPEDLRHKLDTHGMIDIYFDIKKPAHHYFDLYFLAE